MLRALGLAFTFGSFALLGALLSTPALASVPRSISASLASTPSTIRVRISEGAPVVNVQGYDLRIFSASAPGGARKLAAIANRETRWELRCEDGRIRASRTSGDGVGESTLDLAEPVVMRSPAGFIRYDDKPYREELRIYSAGSLCEVVNEVELEKYLEGLVNAEFNSHWNEQAIGAQVVAARTYAVFQMRQSVDRHYDVDATTQDQVYDGSMKEDARAARIVEKTRGLILTVRTPHGIEPLKAYYHSTCGGETELPEKVWGTKTPGFRRVICPYCAHSPVAHWSVDLSSKDLAQSLKRGGFPARGKLLGLRIASLDASGRVDQIVLTYQLGSKSRDWKVSGAKFRDWFGPARFKSTAFQVQTASFSSSGPTWRFSGRGNGHGVGMCQWGAKTMGEKGFKTAAILKFYYPEAQLKKFW